jgi:hypothetical protein
MHIKHSSIGCSRYEIVFGRKPIMLVDIILSNRVNVDSKPLADYLNNLLESSAQCQNKVRSLINKSQERQKEYNDRFIRNSSQFNLVDLELLVNESPIIGQIKIVSESYIWSF